MSDKQPSYTDIINDEGFKEYCINLVFDDCDWSSKKTYKGQWGADWDEGYIEYYILHKCREAINKDKTNSITIHLFDQDISVLETVKGTTDYSHIEYFHKDYNGQEIEALASALWNKFKEDLK